MASKYYDSTGKTVYSGDLAKASDLNTINTAVNTGFEQVESDINSVSDEAGDWALSAENWASKTEDVEVEPGKYSALHYAAKAEDSASAASSSASSASSSASSASSSASTATSAKNDAESAQTAAESAQTAAETAETNAETAETNAETARDYANEWATKAQSSQVDDGVNDPGYSAYHYSKVAESYVMSMPSGVEMVGNIIGLDLEYDVSGDSDNDVIIRVGSCMDSTNNSNILLSSELTKRLDASWAVGTGNGGLLNGSKSNSTVYHVYALLKDSDSSVDAGFLEDGDSLASYLPSGYSKFRWLGFVTTDSSGNIIRFVMSGDSYAFTQPTKATIVSNFSSSSFTSLSLSSMVPEDRITEVYLGVVDSSSFDPLLISYDGTNVTTVAMNTSSVGDTTGAYGADNNYKALRQITYDGTLYARVDSGLCDIGIAQVRLKR